MVRKGEFDNTYARLPEALFTPVEPATVRSPQLAILNDRLADELGVEPEQETLVFDTTADSLTALVNGQIDAVVQDLESANYITSEQFEGLAIAGQLP